MEIKIGIEIMKKIENGDLGEYEIWDELSEIADWFDEFEYDEENVKYKLSELESIGDIRNALDIYESDSLVCFKSDGYAYSFEEYFEDEQIRKQEIEDIISNYDVDDIDNKIVDGEELNNEDIEFIRQYI